jgi:hypothetical protein
MGLMVLLNVCLMYYLGNLLGFNCSFPGPMPLIGFIGITHAPRRGRYVRDINAPEPLLPDGM